MKEEAVEEMAWERVMWEELYAQEGAARLIMAMEIITRMSHVMTTAVARERRLWAVHLVESGQYTYEQLADSIGCRLSVARRLVEEGRAVRREEERMRGKALAA